MLLWLANPILVGYHALFLEKEWFLNLQKSSYGNLSVQTIWVFTQQLLHEKSWCGFTQQSLPERFANDRESATSQLSCCNASLIINCTSISSWVCLASAFTRMLFPKAHSLCSFQKLSITYFSNQFKALIQDVGIGSRWEAINTVCFGRKVISNLRDSAENCSLSSETFTDKLYHSKVASCRFDFFSLFTALPSLAFINKHH